MSNGKGSERLHARTKSPEFPDRWAQTFGTKEKQVDPPACDHPCYIYHESYIPVLRCWVCGAPPNSPSLPDPPTPPDESP